MARSVVKGPSRWVSVMGPGHGGEQTGLNGEKLTSWTAANKQRPTRHGMKRSLSHTPWIRLLPVALVVGALWSWGCSDPSATQRCETERDCRFGEICRAYRCTIPSRCNANSDCPATEVCSSRICQPKQCQDQSDCGEARVCLSGFCGLPPAGFCSQDLDCLSGQCNLMNMTCVITSPCAGDACLPDGQPIDPQCDMGNCSDICEELSCQSPQQCHQETARCVPILCTDDGQCPEDSYCQDDRCQLGCRLSADTCPDAQCDAISRQCVRTHCTHHRDCEDGTCRIDMMENQINHTCHDQRPPTGRISCTADEECVTGACTNDGLCYWPCREQAHCRDGDCLLTTWSINGQSIDLLSCMSEQRVCTNDIDCRSGQTCLPTIQSQKTLLTCQPSPPGRLAGAPCDEDAPCQSRRCTDGHCWGPCLVGQGQHCGGGMRCYPDVHYLPAQAMDPVEPYIGFAGCLPQQGSGTECSSLSCQEGDICLLRPDHTRANWAFRCFAPRGPRRGGAACQQDLDCRSGWCGSSQYCIEPCTAMVEQDICIGGSLCENVLLELWEEEGGAVLSAPTRICVP